MTKEKLFYGNAHEWPDGYYWSMREYSVDLLNWGVLVKDGKAYFFYPNSVELEPVTDFRFMDGYVKIR
jgi:hypothetical protein